MDGNDIFDWSDRVGEPYFSIPKLSAALTILWLGWIDDEFKFNDLGTIEQGAFSRIILLISWFV